ncbi:hypothetical protein LXL04_035699 [Taraxacum kok-saghyz]
MATLNDKIYGITNIKSYVPLVLDLDRLNYDAWRELFKTHCIAYKVYDHLDGTSSKPNDPEWCTVDSIVKQWLYGTLTQPLIQTVLKADATAAQLWKTIEDLFRDNKEANAIELENQLRNIVIGDSTVMEYYTRIKSISDLLANIGAPVSQRNLVTYALNGMSSKFDHIATTIRHKTSFPTLLEMRSMLTLEEQTMLNHQNRVPLATHTDHASSHQVLNTNHQQRSSNRGGRSHRGGGRGRTGRGRGGQRHGSGGGSYFHVPPPSNSGVGGWFYWSPVPPTQSAQSTNSSAGLLPSPKQTQWPTSMHPSTHQPHNWPNSSTAQPTQAYMAGPQIPNNNSWQWAQHPSDQPTSLHQAFSTMNLQDPGTADWYMDTGSTAHLHADPVRKLTRDNKCTIEFDEFGFSVKDFLTRQTLLRCDSSGDLYPVTNPSPQAFLSVSSSTWHQRLGASPPTAATATSGSSSPSHSQPSFTVPGNSPSDPHPSPSDQHPSPSDQHPFPAPDPSNTHPMTTRARLGIFKPTQKLNLHTDSSSSPVPKSYSQAFQDPHWFQAMTDEYNALITNRTWVLVPRPPNANIVNCIWLFKKKHNADGSLARYKAHLVANGRRQRPGVDCDETFSPVVKPATIRTVLSLAISHHWPVHQLDVKNAFLHGHLQETVYMHQPPGFRDRSLPDHVCLLQKSLYGLKQAPRAWFHRFAEFITRFGFTNSKSDSSLFVYRQGAQIAYLLLYVDDIVLTASSSTLLQQVISTLSSEFAMTDLGALNYFLGIAVTRDSQGMFLSQRKYAIEILERAKMLNCKPARTPADTSAKFDGTGPPVADPTLYRSLAGALQYLTFTIPDITYAVQQICLFMHDPREPHFAALKRILRYIRGTVDHGLQLYASSSRSLIAYSDADWAGCPTTRRSTSGYCVFMGQNLLSWSSKRQGTISRSSAEAEYRGVANAVAETSWLRNLLRELHCPPLSATLVYCDNVSAVYMSTNSVQHQRTKHIEIDIHFVRDKVAMGQIRVLHVPSSSQYADIFTKGLPSSLFLDFRSSLNATDLRHVINSNKERRNPAPQRTYVEILRGDEQRKHPKPHEEDRNRAKTNKKKEILTFKTSEGQGRNHELEGRYVGEVKNIKALTVIKSVLIGEGFRDNSIDYLGGMWILIRPNSEGDYKKLNEDSSLRSWFKTLKQWDASFKVKERLTWLNIERIPINLWSPNTLIQIARRWEEVLQTDTCNLGGSMCHKSLVCIKSEIQDLIWSSERIIVDNEIHTIRIKEVEIKELGEYFRIEPDYHSAREENLNQDEDSTQDGSSSDDDFPTSEFRSESEDDGFSYVPNSKATLNAPMIDHAEKTNSTSEAAISNTEEFNGPTKTVTQSLNQPIPNQNSCPSIDLNRDILEEEEPVNKIGTDGPSTRNSPSFSSLSAQVYMAIGISNPEKESNNKSKSMFNDTDNSTPIPIPSKPRPEKLKTRMNDKEDSNVNQSKIGAIQTLNFSPRITRSKTRRGGTQLSGFNYSNQEEESQHGSCSMNVEEMNFAYSIGQTIGFRNTGSTEYQGDAESKRGETTGFWIESGAEMYFINIYADQSKDKRKELWAFISAVLCNWQGQTVIVGDFNEVRKPNERRGSQFDKAGALEFDKFIKDNELEDLKIGEETSRGHRIYGDGRENVGEFRLGRKSSQITLSHEKDEDRFKQNREEGWSQDLSNIKKIDEEQKKDLENPFTEEERKIAFWDCGRKKSPGPDGCTVEFIKGCWHMVKEDIIEALKEFHANATIPRGCNSAFIALIPKKLDTLEVQDYRPISLVGIIFKILSKSLALRLKKVLHTIINPTQSAFVQDRQILDGPLIINEIVDWAKKKKKKIMALLSTVWHFCPQYGIVVYCLAILSTKIFMFKTDIAKAYDSVSWDYLDTMMEAMNFGQKWRNWIHACLASSAMSFLVNSSPTNEFVMERGLRQGDPIAAFLFTLIMEGLNLAVNKAVENGLFKDLKVGEWNLDNALCMISILMCFRKASGLRVNYEKSSLFGIGLDEDSVVSMSNLLGCKAGKLPAIFLGIPIGSNMKMIEKWAPIAEKFRKKMSNWKAKTLSIGGRLTIVSNIMGGIPNFWASMFPMPKGVIKQLENMRRDFFWGRNEEGRPIPWVKWSIACKQRKNGGLGIIGIEDMNISLLTKWIWRFRKEENATWVNIGNGEDTSFWADKWHESGILKSSFPRLFALEIDKDVKAKDRINRKVEEWERRRAVRGGREGEEALNMQDVCNSKTLSNKHDTWIATGAPNGEFSTGWFRDFIECHKVMGQTQQNFWNKWVPKKHNIFIWRVIIDRIPTRRNLSDKGIDIPCTLCPICEENEDDSFHLFFACTLAVTLWRKFGEWWKLNHPDFQRNEDPLIWSWFALKNKTDGARLQVAIIAMLVSI